jgi:hypothetical protein
VKGFLKLVLMSYLPRLASNHDLPNLCSWIARITGMSHQCQSCNHFWRFFLLDNNFK